MPGIPSPQKIKVGSDTEGPGKAGPQCRSARCPGDPVAAYRRAWSLDPDGPAIETPSSWVQPVRSAGAGAMLKVLKPGSDERHGAGLLGYFDGDGAVALLKADGRALLMERAEGRRSLVAMAARGGDVRAAAILADVVARLHRPRPHPPPAGLTPLRRRFRALLEGEKLSDPLARCASVAGRLLDGASEIAALHGDLHHDNVVDTGQRGWLAIDPKGVLGDRTYETANLLCNPVGHGDLVHVPRRMRRLAGHYAERLNLRADRVLAFAFAHAGLSACWSVADGQDPSFALKSAETLAPLVD